MTNRLVVAVQSSYVVHCCYFALLVTFIYCCLLYIEGLGTSFRWQRIVEDLLSGWWKLIRKPDIERNDHITTFRRVPRIGQSLALYTFRRCRLN